jgi:hypothetical protein
MTDEKKLEEDEVTEGQLEGVAGGVTSTDEHTTSASNQTTDNLGITPDPSETTHETGTTGTATKTTKISP